MSNERGSVPIWFLGLGFCLLMLGSMSAELWRIMGERQELVAMADGAALAAASAIDLEIYRERGIAVLDPTDASSLALAVISQSSGAIHLAAPPVIEVADDGSSVRVELKRQVPFGLIRFLSVADESFEVTGVAVAYPFSP
ncbi:MAG TPA: pilus assembly protein TadG-related protein [Acidimicrobiia bacterium]|nr:pilus assembly protein TadG-related protein [Acidimicrobiia bacterium]